MGDMEFDIGPFSVSAHKSQFVAFGMQIGGYGQSGLFVWFGARRLWLRVSATCLRGRARFLRFRVW